MSYKNVITKGRIVSTRDFAPKTPRVIVEGAILVKRADS